MTTSIEAAGYAKRLLGLYPEIQATDPKEFLAALVQLLSYYPHPVIERAIDPVLGIPAKLDRWNLSIAAIKRELDDIGSKYAERLAEREREQRRKLAPPEPDNPEMRERVLKGLKELSEHLKAGFSPSTASDFTSGLK